MIEFILSIQPIEIEILLYGSLLALLISLSLQITRIR